MRVLAVLTAWLLLCGGTANADPIGDSIRALGTDPNRKLVMPRIIALILMLPIILMQEIY